jgi:Peptidase U49
MIYEELSDFFYAAGVSDMRRDVPRKILPGCMNTLTPISVLSNAIAASPFRVAPEIAANLASEVASKDIKLEFTNDPKVCAEYVVSKSLIRLGQSFLSALWTAAHAYIVTYQEYQIAQKKGVRYFALAESPRVVEAYTLYRRAREAVANRQHFHWPPEARKPIRYPFEHSDGYAANELFLVAISWVMHHEIAHARLEHEEFALASISQELDADAEATRWVCSGEKDIHKLHKRAMGMATAVVFLLALDIHVGRRTTTTHPPSFERLMTNLDNTGLSEDQMIYSFAFVLVDIHLAQSQIKDEVDREGSFRDMCISACMLLKALGQDAVSASIEGAPKGRL